MLDPDNLSAMLQETKGAQLGIRAAKMKEAQMRAEGVPGGRAARAASGADKKKASKAKQKRARWEHEFKCHRISTAPCIQAVPLRQTRGPPRSQASSVW